MKQAGNNASKLKDIYSLRNQWLRFRRDVSPWSVWVLLLGLIIGLPVFTIVVSLFNGPGEMWAHISEHLLGTYISNTMYLVLGCGLLSTLLGVSSAWFVSQYNFYGRRQLEWILILPLATPAYITAYAYKGIFEFSGSLAVLLRQLGIPFQGIDIMNLPGLIIVLSLSLYPYIYVSTRLAFLHQAGRLKEAGLLLGTYGAKYFFSVALPLARPAIVGGLMLVIMEVLNDYGAAHYYGINTFTTGIFRSWFSLEDQQTAIYLSAILVAMIFSLLLVEKWQRKNKKYATASTFSNRNLRIQVRGKVKIIVIVTILIPVFFGFFLPLGQLIYWAVLTWKKVINHEFFQMIAHSFGIALTTAAVTTLIALLLIYMAAWNRLHGIKHFARSSTLGYAIPGAIIAIGVLIPTLAVDKVLIHLLDEKLGISSGFIISGTIAALVYAYLVRFMSVAYQPLEAASLKIGSHLSESSRMLGAKHFKSLFKIELPLLKTGLTSAVILVFIDVLKELPLTLILKPYQIQTLAVKAYEYASDEMVAESALPSLCIIFTGGIVIGYLNRFIRN